MPCVAQESATIRKQRWGAVLSSAVILGVLSLLSWFLWSTDQNIKAEGAKKDAAALVLANQLRQLPAEQQTMTIGQFDEPARVAEQLGDGYVVCNKESYVTLASVSSNGKFFETIWVTEITNKGKQTHKYKLVH